MVLGFGHTAAAAASMKDSASRNLNLAHEIPHDLILEILPKLPAKSLFRFKSVSKLWFSIIRTKHFAKTFLTHSRTRPRLLFTFKDNISHNQFVFSAPEHDNSSSSVVARCISHLSCPDNRFLYILSGPVNGFFCCRSGSSIRVCNPTTRQVVQLPDIVGLDHGKVILGYDPVGDQYKVLCSVPEYLVCTVRSGQKEEWRKIETVPGNLYTKILDGICVDGVIYFGVDYTNIARFDVRTEKIDFIQGPRGYKAKPFRSTLMNYHGKLGALYYGSKMHLWSLEKEERTWNNVTCKGPSDWDDFLRHKKPYFPGQIYTGELMMFTHHSFQLGKPFSFLYCDPIRKSLRRVQVLGIADREFRRIHRIDTHMQFILCFPGHIENIVFL